MLARFWAWLRGAEAPLRAPAPAPRRPLVPAPGPAAPAPLTLEDLTAIVTEPTTVRPPDLDVVATIAQRVLFELDDDAFTIPAFPAAVGRVLELTRDPTIDLNALVRALHWEPSTVAQIVRLANAARFARKLDDLRSAVIALGLTEVGSIAAAVSARALFEPESKAEFELFPDHWVRSQVETLAIAFTAGWLAQARALPRYDRVFLRGVITGATRSLGLRGLATAVLGGRATLPAPVDIDAAIDAVRLPVYKRAIERWALPESVSTVVDPASGSERACVELVVAVAELRRSPSQHSSAITALDHAQALGLDAGWLRVLVTEYDQGCERARSILGAGDRRPRPAARPIVAR